MSSTSNIHAVEGRSGAFIRTLSRCDSPTVTVFSKLASSFMLLICSARTMSKGVNVNWDVSSGGTRNSDGGRVSVLEIGRE